MHSFALLFALSFKHCTVKLSPPIGRSWWNQWEVMTASYCHSWCRWWSDALWVTLTRLIALILVVFMFSSTRSDNTAFSWYVCLCGMSSAITLIFGTWLYPGGTQMAEPILDASSYPLNWFSMSCHVHWELGCYMDMKENICLSKHPLNWHTFFFLFPFFLSTGHCGQCGD